MHTKVNFTGAVAAATQLVASAADEQIQVKQIHVAVGKAQSGKLLKFYAANGGAAPFHVVDIGTVGTTQSFNPATPYALAAAAALHYEADSTTGLTNVTILADTNLL